MKKYNINNYEYDLLPQEKWYDYPFNTKMVGIVTNKDDVDFGIPILLDLDSCNKEALPYPHLMCKSTKGLYKGKDYKTCPWIIKCDINDIINLLKSDENTIVALYHEIGHFHYSDEQKQGGDDSYRMSFLMNNTVSPDEVQADSLACEILGKDRVIKALNATIIPIIMNPVYNNTVAGKLFVKEIQLRIEEINKM